MHETPTHFTKLTAERVVITADAKLTSDKHDRISEKPKDHTDEFVGDLGTDGVQTEIPKTPPAQRLQSQANVTLGVPSWYWRANPTNTSGSGLHKR